MPYVPEAQYSQMMSNFYGQMQTQNPYFYQQTNVPQRMDTSQMQRQIPQPSQTSVLNGQFVDSIDFVKAQNVDLSGNPVFYPAVDRTTIYVKQLSSTGQSQILTYALVTEEKKEETPKNQNIVTKDELEKMKQDIIAEITAVKDMFNS